MLVDRPRPAGRVRRAARAGRAVAARRRRSPTGKERGKAFGIYGAIAGGGGAIGLLLGGVLTEYLAGAGACYVNLVFAVVAVVGALILLVHEQAARTAPSSTSPAR